MGTPPAEQPSWDALRESEATFRLLAETARVVIFIHQNGRFVSVNPYMCEASGYSQQELLAMDILQLVHPDDRRRVEEYGRRRMNGEAAPERYTIRTVTKSGEEQWLELSNVRVDYHGHPAILGTGYDITERKRITESLQRSETTRICPGKSRQHNISKMTAR